jgi:hypothetical protein
VVRYGPLGGGFPNTYDAGDASNATLDNLPDGATLSFVVAAYDAVGTRSPFSNEVSATVPYGPITAPTPTPRPPTPKPPPEPTPPPAPTPPPGGESPSGTTIEPGSGSFVDDRGDTYTLDGGPGAWDLWQVYVNGSPNPWGWAGSKCVWSNREIFCLAGDNWWYQNRDNGTGYLTSGPH